ncbi:MAG: cellulase family glycosylhydrolase [Planctomycetota bacterium]
MLLKNRFITALCTLCSFGAAGSATAHVASMPEVVLDDGRFVTRSGEVVPLHGVNLGNWLLIEPWMFGIFDSELDDQHGFVTVLRDRFGDRADDLLRIHRDHWITERDVQRIASFGMTLIRLPIHYSVIEDPSRPGELRADGLDRIDRLLDWCERHGLYVVLDMHGAPGGQSVDAPTGRRHQNKLWGDAVLQDRFVSLWVGLAKRYGARPSVAMYDLLNEPYGDFAMNVEPALAALMDRAHNEIRRVDDDTPILFPGTERGFRFYGDPEDHGWTGVAFTEHYYPGVFGGEPSIAGHQAFAGGPLVARARYLESIGATLLVGEYNAIFDRVQADRLNAEYTRLFDQWGWASTQWSYKLHKAEPGVGTDNWYVVTNREPAPLDIRTMSFEEIAEALRIAGGEPAVDEDLANAIGSFEKVDFRILADAANASLELDRVSPPSPGEYTRIGGQAAMLSLETGHAVRASFTGTDIWGKHDACVMLDAARASDRRSLTIEVESLDAPRPWAKLGPMLRASDDAGASFVLLHVLPDARVRIAQRTEAGVPVEEFELADAAFPVELRMERTQEGDLIVEARWDDGTAERRITAPGWLAEESLFGVAGSSNDAFSPANAVYRVLGGGKGDSP